MSKKPNKFDDLRKEWYDKLKSAGFEDAENFNNHLKFWDTNRLYNKAPEYIANAREYYRLAEHFLCIHKFESEYEKVIWEYHANGMSVRDITKVLKKVKSVKTNYNSVWAIVKEIRAKMKFHYKVYSSNDKPN